MNNDLERYVLERIEAAQRELVGNHAWEIRRLTARAEDAEKAADRYRSSYKSAIMRLRKMRKQLARATANLRAAGLGQSEPTQNGEPALDTVQGVLDMAVTRIPGMDDMAQGHTRAYIEREMRSRGAKAGPEILNEVISGGYIED